MKKGIRLTFLALRNALAGDLKLTIGENFELSDGIPKPAARATACHLDEIVSSRAASNELPFASRVGNVLGSGDDWA